MLKLSENKATELANLAIKTGFYLKRSYDVKLDIARSIKEQLSLSCTGEDMLEHLTATKPIKKAAKPPKVAPAPTFTGSALAKERQLQVTAGDKFIITYAQNETAVNRPVFESLKRYAENLNAHLIVMKGHYNISAFSGQCKGDKEIYAEELRPYLVDESQFLGYFQGVLLSDVNTLPTAIYPVNAAGNLIGNSECIILGHTKQQAKTLPVMKGEKPRWGYTTGTVTVRNYVTSAAGAKAESDHAYGALLVEVCDESLQWQARHLKADELDGSFYDLNLYVTPDSIRVSEKPFSMVLGDIHAEKLDRDFWNKTLDFIDAYKPQKVVLHDILDFSSRNHHRRDSGHFLASQVGETVKNDIAIVSQTLVELRNAVENGDLIVVYSNHDDALIRWLDCNKYDPRKDPVNAVTYHKLNAAVYADIINKEPERPILETALAELQLDSAQATFLLLDQSCNVNGVEVGFHGDKGVNGSKGSPVLYSKQGISMVTGHTHSPSMYGDVTTVGCCNLEQGYNKGLSSWALCHAIIYPNGHKTLITM